MIILTTPATETVLPCPLCQRHEGVTRFGAHRGGNPRYQCAGCRKTFCLNPGTTAHPPEFKAMVGYPH